MTRRPLVVLAVAVALALALAGSLTACSSGGDGSPGGSAGTNADIQRQLDISRQVSQCARAHGYPAFPDPVIDANEIVYPDTAGLDLKETFRALEQVPECKALLDQRNVGRPSDPPVSAEDLTKLREFAKCVRAHGIPEWPDPRADGTFPINGTPLENEGKSDRFLSAVDACKSIYDKRIATS
jgi:hypothetical protein